MLTLCVLPTRPRSHTAGRALAGTAASHGMRSALLGVALGTAIAVAMVAASAFVFNAGAERSMRGTLLVAGGAVAFAGGAILLFALEGLLCLAMAAPLAFALAFMGAVAGRALAMRSAFRIQNLALLMIPLPVVVVRPQPQPREVLTVVEIDAPPLAVWPHVVAFSSLPEPPTWIFRLGIAYARKATIVGRGAGAVRRCEFSTGAFVEPITDWDEPRRLAFDVAAQPPPMTELSPYRHVLAPHLDSYLVVRRGEFRLVPLIDGRTRLEGRTFYEMRVYPAEYWRLWSDALIHKVHVRVLEHIETMAEGSGRPAGRARP